MHYEYYLLAFTVSLAVLLGIGLASPANGALSTLGKAALVPTPILILKWLPVAIGSIGGFSLAAAAMVASMVAVGIAAAITHEFFRSQPRLFTMAMVCNLD